MGSIFALPRIAMTGAAALGTSAFAASASGGKQNNRSISEGLAQVNAIPTGTSNGRSAGFLDKIFGGLDKIGGFVERLMTV